MSVGKHIIEKASVANLSALFAVIAITVAAIVYQKWEILSMVVGGALTYLWPKLKE